MDADLRAAYNAAFTPGHYRRYLEQMERQLGMAVPFRVAETPLFLPPALRARMERAAREIVEQISDPVKIARMESAVPARLNVPRRDALASSIQVDLAIVRDEAGELDVKLVELQGFPSLYAFTIFQMEALSEQLATMPGLDRSWSCFFSGLDRASYIARLRALVVGDQDPREVILMDLDPPQQKTAPDFVATKKLLDVDAVCPTTLRREGRKLYREVDGRSVPVKRIYNRVVFDELESKKITLPFAYTDDLDVTWVPHPNWYWIWSKFTLPQIHHPACPRAWLVSELPEIPSDLANYVLKPLFSFAGSGVKIDVTPEDIRAIPADQRDGWLLMERIHYAPALKTPEGHGVKAEVRMMFLRPDGEQAPQLVMNLVRLSRGKMHGVDHNRDLDWVGGTVGLFPADR